MVDNDIFFLEINEKKRKRKKKKTINKKSTKCTYTKVEKEKENKQRILLLPIFMVLKIRLVGHDSGLVRSIGPKSV